MSTAPLAWKAALLDRVGQPLRTATNYDGLWLDCDRHPLLCEQGFENNRHAAEAAAHGANRPATKWKRVDLAACVLRLGTVVRRNRQKSLRPWLPASAPAFQSPREPVVSTEARSHLVVDSEAVV